MSSNGNVQIRDYSDRELLAIMLDLGGEVSSPDLAARVYGWGAIESEDKGKVAHGRRCVTSRLIWMRRFGLVESWVAVESPKVRTWKVSPVGIQLRQAKLGRAVDNAISNSPDAQMLEMANLVGERFYRGSSVARTAMRRELQFHIARGK